MIEIPYSFQCDDAAREKTPRQSTLSYISLYIVRGMEYDIYLDL